MATKRKLRDLDLIQKLITQNSDLQGSFLNDLFTVMAKGQFKDSYPEKKPGETTICEMNFVERSLRTLIIQYAEREREIEDVEQENQDGNIFSSPEEKLAVTILKIKLTGRANLAQKYLEESINERIPYPQAQYVGARKGFLIVQKPKESEQCISFLQISMAELFALTGTEYSCDVCPNCEEPGDGILPEQDRHFDS